MQRYQIFRCDRIDKNGDEVAFYLANTLTARILKTSGDYLCKPEFIIAEVLSDSKEFLLAVVYRLPHVGYLTNFLFTDIPVS